jgi:hypothetical protein
VRFPSLWSLGASAISSPFGRNLGKGTIPDLFGRIFREGTIPTPLPLGEDLGEGVFDT